MGKKVWQYYTSELRFWSPPPAPGRNTSLSLLNAPLGSPVFSHKGEWEKQKVDGQTAKSMNFECKPKLQKKIWIINSTRFLTWWHAMKNLRITVSHISYARLFVRQLPRYLLKQSYISNYITIYYRYLPVHSVNVKNYKIEVKRLTCRWPQRESQGVKQKSLGLHL